MYDALKSFNFCIQNVNAQKLIFFFFFIKLPWKCFFMKEYVKNLYNLQFCQFCNENNVYLA